MKTKTITIRFRWKDWTAIRSIFPGKYDESAADYISRLTEFLYDKYQEQGK